MYTILCEVPTEIKVELEALAKRNRLIKSFVIIGCEKFQKGYQLGVQSPELFWGSPRKRIESQLIDAGVCRPELLPSQELAWKSLCQVLSQFHSPNYINGLLWDECRSSVLNGLVDELESKLPLFTFLKCKTLIKELGEDRFSLDFKWYFGQSPEEVHAGEGDYWRGLE